MGNIHIHVHVKFRMFGVTFGEVDTVKDFPIPVPLPKPIPKTVLFNDRGVLLEVSAS